MTTDDELRDRIWTDLYRRIVELLRRYGKEDAIGEGDFWVVDDNYGWRRHTVYVNNLKLLSPNIVASLRGFLDNLPDWAIVLALNVPGNGKNWPPMGLTIRKHEIIDGLMRNYLPEPYRTLVFPGSRPGTGFD
jgi:hypothetical protein